MNYLKKAQNQVYCCADGDYELLPFTLRVDNITIVRNEGMSSASEQDVRDYIAWFEGYKARQDAAANNAIPNRVISPGMRALIKQNIIERDNYLTKLRAMLPQAYSQQSSNQGTAPGGTGTEPTSPARPPKPPTGNSAEPMKSGKTGDDNQLWGMPKTAVIVGGSLFGAGILTIIIVAIVKHRNK